MFIVFLFCHHHSIVEGLVRTSHCVGRVWSCRVQLSAVNKGVFGGDKVVLLSSVVFKLMW